jgi:hypothetical protein
MARAAVAAAAVRVITVGRVGLNAVVRVVDADKNGELSAAELANAPAAIRTLDTNTDGTILADELRPARPADAPTPPAGAPERPPHAAGRTPPRTRPAHIPSIP